MKIAKNSCKKLFDIAKKESIYISQKKIQAAPRQITITLFIIINKIVLLDIFVQLISCLLYTSDAADEL